MSTHLLRRLQRRLAVVVAAALVLGACSGSGDAARGATDLPMKTAEAADVTVKVTPARIGPGDAVFTLSLASVYTELDVRLDMASRLTVDGVSWKPATWDGDGPGGRSTEGRLEFRGNGPARDRAVLRIDGFAKPLTFTWPL